MKKVILPILAISMLIAIPIMTNAAIIGDTGDSGYAMQDIPTATSINIWELLLTVLTWFFNIALIVAAIFIVYAGWQYITAGGDDEKTKKGLSTLVQAIIGIAIILLAKVIIYFVSNMITGTPISID